MAPVHLFAVRIVCSCLAVLGVNHRVACRQGDALHAQEGGWFVVRAAVFLSQSARTCVNMASVGRPTSPLSKKYQHQGYAWWVGATCFVDGRTLDVVGGECA